MINIPSVKAGIVAVSRDCFPESLSVNRRKLWWRLMRRNMTWQIFTSAPYVW